MAHTEGYYWVVFLPDVADEWTIAEYWNDKWWVIGGDEGHINSTPEEDLLIGEFISPQRPFNKELWAKGSGGSNEV
jgi:hypothetical protein